MKPLLLVISLFAVTACGGGTSSHSGTSEKTNQSAPSRSSVLPGEQGFSLIPRAGSFLGGRFFERAQVVYTDQQGYIYIGGHTKSDDFPVTAGAYQTDKMGPSGIGNNMADGFVTKLSPDGKRVIWSTLIGGRFRDQVYAIRTDSAGNVYLLGATGSDDFPVTTGAYDDSFNGPIRTNGLSDVFLASLTPDGSQLRFSTFIGGRKGVEENPRGAIYLDEKNRRIYVAGGTTAADFPTTAGTIQPQFGGGRSDAFIFVMSMNGSRLIASTYFGGKGSDTAVTGIAAHPSGDSVYIAGATTSPDFPVSADAFQTKIASGNPNDLWWKNGDAFVARLSVNLDKIIFSSFYGGNRADAVSHNNGLTVNSDGNVIIIGHTQSPDLPMTRDAYDHKLSSTDDAFIAIFNDTGKLVSSTYLGGNRFDEIAGVVTDPYGHIIVTGGTESDDFITTNLSYQTTHAGPRAQRNNSDAFVTVFDQHLKSVLYSTYLGGPGVSKWTERGRACWITKDGRLLVGGVTNSDRFPFPGSTSLYRFGGYTDAFFMMFDIRNTTTNH